MSPRENQEDTSKLRLKNYLLLSDSKKTSKLKFVVNFTECIEIFVHRGRKLYNKSFNNGVVL